MATQVAMLIAIILLVAIYYLKPLIVERLQTKRVVVKYINREGIEKRRVLYLRKDDPLWSAIKATKRGGADGTS